MHLPPIVHPASHAAPADAPAAAGCCFCWLLCVICHQSLYDQVVQGIASARRVSPAAVKSAVDGSPLLASQAMQAKLLDGLAYRCVCGERWRVSGRAAFCAMWARAVGFWGGGRGEVERDMHA